MSFEVYQQEEGTRMQEMHGKNKHGINTPADGTDVGDDTQKKNKESHDEQKDSEKNELAKLLEVQHMEGARKKSTEIAQISQAPANNPNQSEAAKIGLQQQEALSQTFP